MCYPVLYIYCAEVGMRFVYIWVAFIFIGVGACSPVKIIDQGLNLFEETVFRETPQEYSLNLTQ